MSIDNKAKRMAAMLDELPSPGLVHDSSWRGMQLGFYERFSTVIVEPLPPKFLAVQPPAVSIYLLTSDLRLGREISGVTSMSASLKWADADAISLSLPANHKAVADLFQPKTGLIIFVNGEPFGGRIIKKEFEETDDMDILNIWAMGFDVHLAERLCLPTPLAAIGGPYGDHDSFTGTAEDAMKYFVDANIGPGARSDRKFPNLVLAESLQRGAQVVKLARWDNLLDMLNSITNDSQMMGFGISVDLINQRLVFDCKIAGDKTSTVAIMRGHRGEGRISIEVPKANYVFTGDSNRGGARHIDERGDSQSIIDWWRIEEFQDFSATTDIPTMEGQSYNFLTTNANQAVASFMIKPTAPYRFMADYKLGDKIRVWVNNQAVDEQVRQVDVRMDQSGLTAIDATVATANTPNANVPKVFRNYKELMRRLARLERL